MTHTARDGRLSRRQVLSGLAVAGSIGLAGCSGGASEEPAGNATPNPPEGSVPDVSIPDDPGEHEYAVMGTGTGQLTATYYGNWKCPYCAQFSTGKLGTLVEDYVEPGTIDIRYRGIARFNGEPFLGEDAAAATRAGLAVWNEEPESYWAFHEYVMSNQPPESESWATPDQLAQMATVAGVDEVEAVRTAAAGDDYAEIVTATGQDAITAGVDSTPALVVGDAVVNPLQGSEAADALDAALE